MSEKLRAFESFLLQRKLVLTPQRRTILEAFEENDTPVKCEDLLQRARKRDRSLSLSTVYRTMKLLLQAGLAFGIHLGDGAFLHAHPCRCDRQIEMRCVQCGAVTSLTCAEMTKQLKLACKDAGCELHSHHDSLTGLCADCVRKAGNGDGA